nr:scarecrow-like protein 18 [Ipomoea batatas]
MERVRGDRGERHRGDQRGGSGVVTATLPHLAHLVLHPLPYPLHPPLPAFQFHQIQRRKTVFVSSSPPPAIQMRQFLISCAELISRSDFSAAHRLISFLASNTSPFADSSERLVHQFTRALSLRLHQSISASSAVS